MPWTMASTDSSTPAGVRFLTMTVSVAASGAFRDRIRDVLRPHVEAAKAGGELREQLDPDAVADWLVTQARG